jgi:hypothetical protein
MGEAAERTKRDRGSVLAAQLKRREVGLEDCTAETQSARSKRALELRNFSELCELRVSVVNPSSQETLEEPKNDKAIAGSMLRSGQRAEPILRFSQKDELCQV